MVVTYSNTWLKQLAILLLGPQIIVYCKTNDICVIKSIKDGIVEFEHLVIVLLHKMRTQSRSRRDPTQTNLFYMIFVWRRKLAMRMTNESSLLSISSYSFSHKSHQNVQKCVFAKEINGKVAYFEPYIKWD